jgi:beta-lactamase class A
MDRALPSGVDWMFDRRAAFAIGAVALVGACTGLPAESLDSTDRLAALERRVGGRLGVCAIDTASGRTIGWRADERFAHCSSFKLSLAALVLHGIQENQWAADHRLTWTEADLLGNSPVTAAHVATGLTVTELARAALVTSDNAATNVLLNWLGGPPVLNRFWAMLNDRTSRLDRFEPELNVVLPGSVLDTTTPSAMAATVAKLVTGDVLQAPARATLVAWMADVQTGVRRLRAGFPAGWAAGDKTGTGTHPQATTYVDLAYAGPPGRAPLIVAAYFVPPVASGSVDPAIEAVLAEVGAIVAAMESAG